MSKNIPPQKPNSVVLEPRAAFRKVLSCPMYCNSLLSKSSGHTLESSLNSLSGFPVTQLFHHHHAVLRREHPWPRKQGGGFPKPQWRAGEHQKWAGSTGKTERWQNKRSEDPLDTVGTQWQFWMVLQFLPSEEKKLPHKMFCQEEKCWRGKKPPWKKTLQYFCSWKASSTSGEKQPSSVSHLENRRPLLTPAYSGVWRLLWWGEGTPGL